MTQDWITAADALKRATPLDLRRAILSGKLPARWADGEPIGRAALLDCRLLDDGRLALPVRNADGVHEKEGSSFVWTPARAFYVDRASALALPVRNAAEKLPLVHFDWQESGFVRAMADVLRSAFADRLGEMNTTLSKTTSLLEQTSKALFKLTKRVSAVEKVAHLFKAKKGEASAPSHLN